VVRSDLGRRRDTLRLRGAEGIHRLARREMQQVQRLLLVGRERQVALDHHALGHRGVPGEPELGRDRSFVHLPAAGERRLLAVEREPPAGDPVVLEGPPHQRRSDERPAVVAEAGGALLGELHHLGQLRAFLAASDRGEKAHRDRGFALRVLDQRAEHRGRVDDGIGVRHREQRAVATCSGRCGSGGDRLLVLPARHA
jgi:hypothetical protein